MPEMPKNAGTGAEVGADVPTQEHAKDICTGNATATDTTDACFGRSGRSKQGRTAGFWTGENDEESMSPQTYQRKPIRTNHESPWHPSDPSLAAPDTGMRAMACLRYIYLQCNVHSTARVPVQNMQPHPKPGPKGTLFQGTVPFFLGHRHR